MTTYTREQRSRLYTWLMAQASYAAHKAEDRSIIGWKANAAHHQGRLDAFRASAALIYDAPEHIDGIDDAAIWAEDMEAAAIGPQPTEYYTGAAEAFHEAFRYLLKIRAEDAR